MVYQTDCSTCFFNESEGDVKCGLGRYEKYKNKGLINENGMIAKLCGACRNEEWAKKYKDEEYYQLSKELTNVYTLMIVDNKDDDGVLDRLKESLRWEQSVQPKQIIFAYHGSFPLPLITTYLNEYTRGKGIEVSVTRIEFQDYDREIIDIAAKKVTGFFYLVQKNGLKLNTEALYRLYEYFEVKLEKVLVVHSVKFGFGEDESYHGLAVNTLYHKGKNGNQYGKIEEKAYLEGNDWCVKTWPMICESRD